MKPKKLLGMVGLMLAFGLVLSSCEIAPATFTLQVRNDFNVNIGISIDELQGTTESPSVQTRILAPGTTYSFSLPHGEYRIVITATGLATPIRYPPLGGFRRMNGDVRFVFNGGIIRE